MTLAIIKLVLSLLLFVLGFWLLWGLGLKVLIGLVLVLWANNLGLSAKEDSSVK